MFNFGQALRHYLIYLSNTLTTELLQDDIDIRGCQMTVRWSGERQGMPGEHQVNHKISQVKVKRGSGKGQGKVR